MPSSPIARARSATARTSSSLEVGGDLDQQRHPVVGGRVGRAAYVLEQGLELLDGLEVAQARGVRRADVDHEVVGVRREQPRALPVVGEHRGLVVVRHDLGLADVDPEHRRVGAVCRRKAAESAQFARRTTPSRRSLPGLPRREPPGDHLGAVVVEAHPVDDRAVLRQPEQPRLRVARLGLARDRADLDVPEAERGQRVDADGVLVEARGEAEDVREGQAHRGTGGNDGPTRREQRRVELRRPRSSTGSAARIARKAAWWACSGSVRVRTWSKSRRYGAVTNAPRRRRAACRPSSARRPGGAAPSPAGCGRRSPRARAPRCPGRRRRAPGRW